ncbi:MAG TPA: SpoIIE family protein phosphatase [Pseudonocardia sp.]|uniref:SpoIIE family protein phosphatase n=1 Tax=Pseudonocardia sp. TaxID=60912 RepID=UPI002EDA8381
MTSPIESFQATYRLALRRHLREPTETTLAAGHEIGRQALSDGLSILTVTEHHFRVLAELYPDLAQFTSTQLEAALQFLLQTLAALDIATRGFLDRTRGYQEQRARAEAFEELAQLRARESAFRRAMMDSLQEGFFVTDHESAITDVNAAFAELTGYPPEGLPYRWPHPWIPGDQESRLEHEAARETISRDGAGRFTLPIRRRDGHRRWLAIMVNSLVEPSDEQSRRIFVGTIRDITAERAAADREHAAAQFHSAVAAATSVPEVIEGGLTALRTLAGVDRAIAAVWSDHNPSVYAVGLPGPVSWASLDEQVQDALMKARQDPLPHVTLVRTLDGAGAGGALAMPISAGGDAAVWLELARPDLVTAEDRSLISLLASQLAQALHRARSYDQARTVSLTLQNAMLSHGELPDGFAVRYEPAVQPLEVGGDWYDVLPLPNNLIGIVVGDCVGRGLAAAAVMGQLRSSCRALLLRGASPGAVLEDLDAVATRIPDARCTTVCCATIDPERGVLTYSSAGHMPAILSRPGRPTELLTSANAVPLATVACAPRPEASTTLTPGATLLLYTDGLVERRGASIDVGISAVASLLAGAAQLTPELVTDAVVDQLRPPSGYDDDVAVLAYRHPTG